MVRICLTTKLFIKVVHYMKNLGKSDSIIADLGLLITDYLENIGASLTYQLFLNDQEQLTKAEMKENQTIGLY